MPAALAAPARQPTLLVRAYVAEVDRSFVLDNWARHIADLVPFARWSAEERKAHTREVIMPLVEHVKPLMAADPNDARHLYGFICGEHQGDRQVLHFLYISRWCRQRGFATALLRHEFPGLGKRTIYHTHPGAAVPFHRQRWLLRFNPWFSNPMRQS